MTVTGGPMSIIEFDKFRPESDGSLTVEEHANMFLASDDTDVRWARELVNDLLDRIEEMRQFGRRQASAVNTRFAEKEMDIRALEELLDMSCDYIEDFYKYDTEHDIGLPVLDGVLGHVQVCRAVTEGDMPARKAVHPSVLSDYQQREQT